MSIALIIVNSADTADKTLYVPVATERLFKEVWLKGAEAIHASWIPLFENGVEFGNIEKDEIIEELEQFREWSMSAGLEENLRKQIKGRIDHLLEALRSLFAKNEQIRVFIG